MHESPSCGSGLLAMVLLLALEARAAPLAVGTPWDTVRAEAQPKPVATDTWLVRDGRPEAVIAVPADPAYRPLAAELQT
ncbi:MAG: hypothetical protein HYU66_07345, partial [Armatimonadetes bacterium]|nr:hypothetical protein [Armatimonadota bacterium]